MSRSENKYFKTWDYRQNLNTIGRYVKEIARAMSSCSQMYGSVFSNFLMTQKQFWRIFCAIPNSWVEIQFREWRIKLKNPQELGTALKNSKIFAITFYYFFIIPWHRIENCFEHQEIAENIIKSLSSVKSVRRSLREFTCCKQTEVSVMDNLLKDNGFKVLKRK